MRHFRPLIVVVAAAAVLAACGSSSSSTANQYGSGAGTTVTPATTAPAATTPATSAGPAAAAGTGECAKADGSSPKTQTFAAEPANCLKDGDTYTAVIVTNFGTLHVKLDRATSPRTVNSFVNLSRFHYFDGTTCHRAIKTFVVQCGDPTATGMGGPGYTFPDELAKLGGYSIGSVAMANSGHDTNGSQFFIITGDAGAQLPPKYNLVGQVDQNDFAAIQALDAVANPQDGPPLQPIDIQSVTITVG